MLQLEIKVLVIENYPDRDFTRAVSPTWGKVDVSPLPWAESSAAQLPLNSLELVDELSCAATKAISMSPPSYSTAPHSSYHRPMPFFLGWLLYQKRQTGNISNRLVPHFVLEVAQMVDPHTHTKGSPSISPLESWRHHILSTQKKSSSSFKLLENWLMH